MNPTAPRWTTIYCAVTGAMALALSLLAYVKPDVQFGTWSALGASGALSLAGPLGLYIARNLATAAISALAFANKSAAVVGAVLTLRAVTDGLDALHALTGGAGMAGAGFAVVMFAIDIAGCSRCVAPRSTAPARPEPMIRLAFMTDRRHVIGASSEEANNARFALLPTGLASEMAKVYAGVNIAGGESSYRQTAQATGRRFVITRNATFDVTGEDRLEICADAADLVTRYAASEDELLIVSGLSMFRFFLPHATTLDVALTAREIPGDLVFDDWRRASFAVVSTWDHGDFQMIRYRRSTVGAPGA